jgi:hypothetical protein
MQQKETIMKMTGESVMWFAITITILVSLIAFTLLMV